MKKILLALMVLGMAGCGNLSPKLQPKLDQQLQNQNGKIDEIKNNQNGIMSEIGTLKNQADITNSTLKDYQQGLMNINARLSSNENSGIQILQGDGALIFVFAISVIALLLYHYRKEAKDAQKVNEIIVGEVAKAQNLDLENEIFKAAKHTNVENQVYSLMVKMQKKS